MNKYIAPLPPYAKHWSAQFSNITAKSHVMYPIANPHALTVYGLTLDAKDVMETSNSTMAGRANAVTANAGQKVTRLVCHVLRSLGSSLSYALPTMACVNARDVMNMHRQKHRLRRK